LQRDDLFIAFHTDISDLKARENEMQETIAYTERLLDQLAGGYLIPDQKKAEIDAIAKIQKRFNSTVSGLASLIAQIMQVGEKIEGVASTLADNQKEVAKRIEDESTSLEEISASLQEMRATTKSVAQQSDETLKVAIETDKSSELAAAKMMELKQLIDDLEQKIHTMIEFHTRYGYLSETNIKDILQNNQESIDKAEEDITDVLVYGNHGKIVKARTINQRKLVEMYESNDLIFAIRPGRFRENIYRYSLSG